MSLDTALALNNEGRYEEANQIFKQLMDRSDLQASIEYAANLFKGLGVKKNISEACQILDKALEISQSIALADKYANLRFQDFDIFSSDVSEEERKEYLEKTFSLFEFATFDSQKPFTYFNFGACFEYGYGTTIDLKRAQENYAISLNICNNRRGYTNTKNKLNFHLGRLRLLDQSTFNQGIQNILTAAEANYVPSFVYAGRLYYEGLLIQKNDARAFYFFKMASKSGICEGQFYLAEMYENGIPNVCEKNINKAIELYFAVATVLTGKNNVKIESLPKICSKPENCEPIGQRAIEKLRTYRPGLLNLLNTYEKCEKNEPKCTLNFFNEKMVLQHEFMCFDEPHLVLNNCICKSCMKNCYENCCVIDAGINKCFCDCMCNH